MREERKRMAIRRCVEIMRSPFAAVRDKLNRNQVNMPGTITSVTTRAPVVALTFDDGPHLEYTPRLLDILQRYQASATFFMIGEVAQKHPELVQLVAQAGHAIGNHSWDHRFFPHSLGVHDENRFGSASRPSHHLGSGYSARPTAPRVWFHGLMLSCSATRSSPGT